MEPGINFSGECLGVGLPDDEVMCCGSVATYCITSEIQSKKQRKEHVGDSFQFDSPRSCPDGVGVRINHHRPGPQGANIESGHAMINLHLNIKGPVAGGTKWLGIAFSRPIVGRYSSHCLDIDMRRILIQTMNTSTILPSMI